ncbi:WHG domain-containing protein [Nocardia sp. NBC_00881]|uniref:TetR/AcrR family transcriptional regulator n=1 Tax=Nocardia sp. NBC_00881 TaxID=2975995 RepID=UPI0038635DE5|nr:WHG domain-containing protein [Nocardia sp. NBC_00881]
MPRAGLSTADVVRAGAELADDVGYGNLTMGLLAERLGVRTPSLYKHVENLADLRRGIAVLAMTELDREIRDAMHGLFGADALSAFARAFRVYVVAHPGRYSATIGAEFTGPDDPLLEPSTRLSDSMTAVLRGYNIPEDEMDHALRSLRSTFHGFASLQASNGFQWTGDPDVSFNWMIDFVDRGLRAARRVTD